MRPRSLISFLVGATLLAGPGAAGKRPVWNVPVDVKTLANGLTVVVSEDHALPTVGVSMVYRVGMRLEPKGRTGFAHLFEHMMFEGTPVARKGVFDRVIQGGGGMNNGSTRYDYTNYIESAPVSALEPILWLEADRLKALDFSPQNLKNQQDVVKEEIRVNVKNRPYGTFWLDLPAAAYSRWENSHDGYGSFEDLDHADLKDVQAFHSTYYTPSNAVLGIAGDVKAADAFALAERYFGGIPSAPKPALPDLKEPLNTKEVRLVKTDALARVPAIALAWKMPERGSKDHAAAAVLSELLVGGEASRVYLGLVKGRELLLRASGGLNSALGGPWDFDGQPLFSIFALYKPNADSDRILAAMDEIIDAVATQGVAPAELDRTKTKMLSDYYAELEVPLSRADAIAKMQALWGQAAQINEIPKWVEGVTAEDLKRVARTYLTRPNRTVIDYHTAPAKN
ncbi:M16 family metallopeptidase [Mesoterricola silvestris]|uniref:Peptidase M16 n=1 Tax=Mesoterricola silvestris TaxID=2927979 RepID=A0AA48GMV7_9BACT|nr:pitrilysin family protein [Mesoterricola silvestris]BDU74337.1 peptidase M16 [Mesoterricola silvestris]